ncbi:Major facilitator superfamily transporter [Cordyceps militaris]|uniref:Major facilitator superfamily transporter n=1 Tax=Cordyceps militaris TaxID=73501 RepID=A0A2H4SKX1_CORMI|nr:Major facilitator superfamily transporter [Cordyceps militaris]
MQLPLSDLAIFLVAGGSGEEHSVIPAGWPVWKSRRVGSEAPPLFGAPYPDVGLPGPRVCNAILDPRLQRKPFIGVSTFGYGGWIFRGLHQKLSKVEDADPVAGGVCGLWWRGVGNNRRPVGWARSAKVFEQRAPAISRSSRQDCLFHGSCALPRFGFE